MHELAIVKSIVKNTERVVAENKAEKAEEIYLRIGALYFVMEDLLNTVFDFVSKGTVCEGARLSVSYIPVTLKCKNCGCIYTTAPREMTGTPCPECACEEEEFLAGKEFFIDQIEVSYQEKTAVV